MRSSAGRRVNLWAAGGKWDRSMMGYSSTLLSLVERFGQVASCLPAQVGNIRIRRNGLVSRADVLRCWRRSASRRALRVAFALVTISSGRSCGTAPTHPPVRARCCRSFASATLFPEVTAGCDKGTVEFRGNAVPPVRDQIRLMSRGSRRPERRPSVHAAQSTA